MVENCMRLVHEVDLQDFQVVHLVDLLEGQQHPLEEVGLLGVAVLLMKVGQTWAHLKVVVELAVLKAAAL